MDHIITEQEYEEYMKLKKSIHVKVSFYDCRRTLTHTAQFDVRLSEDAQEQLEDGFRRILDDYSEHMAEQYKKAWELLRENYAHYPRAIKNQFVDKVNESLDGLKKHVFRKLFAKQLYKLAQE